MIGNPRWAFAAACLASICFGCIAGEAPGELRPIPDKPENEQFKGVSEPWRTYLVKARAAERISNPLQRCLAYPDFPGNRWPQGHAEAHCRYHAIEVIDLEGIDGYLQRGDVSGLEARMDAYLAKHFSETDFGEDIHLVFDHFTEVNEETDRISARWLELAPTSAYANLARGSYFRGMAWDSRGGEWVSETPRDNMSRMSDYAERAIPYLRMATSIEPRLMPAHVALLDIGMLDSRPRLEREAIESANRHDPACLDLVRQRMQAMQPRWGGGYAEMLSIAAELSRHVAKRPQLSIHLAAPYGDRGNRLAAEGEFTPGAMEILDIAVRTGSNERHMKDAAEVALNLADKDGGPQPWKALALFLQETRFDKGNAWTNLQIASRLLSLEPEWSLRHSTRAAEIAANDGTAHYLLATGYRITGQVDAAEWHYLVVAENDRQRRQASLRELSAMWLFNRDLDMKVAASKARPHIDRLLEAYPDDGLGWFFRINEEGKSRGIATQASLDAFLKHADRSDPR